MTTLKRLWRDAGGVGQKLVDSDGRVVADFNARVFWKGAAPAPVGAIIRHGNSRYPKFFQVAEA